MPISFSCHKCGRKLKAPERAAGRSSNCPGCGTQVTCPEPVYEAEAVPSASLTVPELVLDDPDDSRPYGLDAEEAPPLPAAEARRPCPMCGEMVLASAAKCRFCGEVFDQTLKKAASKKKKKKKSRGSSSEDDDLSPLDSLVVIVAFVGLFVKYGIIAIGVGLAMSVVYMIQGKRKGLKMFAILIVVFIIAVLVVAVFIFNQMRNGQPVVVD